jgi:hypothetical protein
MQEYRLQKTATNEKSGVGQHAGIMGQHEQEWWVNMRRNLHVYPVIHIAKIFEGINIIELAGFQQGEK